MTDPLAGSAWSSAETVQGFVRSPPNATLLELAARERAAGGRCAIDIGCGAGRNLVPLAAQGWTILGTDLSWPMLEAARSRVHERAVPGAALALAPMESLPVRPDAIDLIVAHGVWNLARTTAQFRRAVLEASRIAREGAALFVFTFSRRTIPAAVSPVPGEAYVYTQFSGQPQCFLTREELLGEMASAGFARDPSVPLAEHNVPRPGQIQSSAPVIWEAAFRRNAR